MPTREEVYRAIDSERYYQNYVVDPDPNRRALPEHSVGDYLVLAKKYLNDAFCAWTDKPGTGPTMEEIRKVAGILVKAMEQHGAPMREKRKVRFPDQ